MSRLITSFRLQSKEASLLDRHVGRGRTGPSRAGSTSRHGSLALRSLLNQGVAQDLIEDSTGGTRSTLVLYCG
jgi:hypothetical protein